ncbi:MAG TPA: hypothetical protein VIV40_27770 [Kofleriaceae bacterium]
MAPREQLEREIERLEARLDDASSARVIDELAAVRRGLASCDARPAGIELPNLRIGFACKQRWEHMVGDDRVRACGGCERPVFNLSAMTRVEAEAVLATRGLTPCVRFYRRPDGTVMTSDCPTGARPAARRLAVMASSLTAAGTALAAPSVAMADPPAVAGSADTETTVPPAEGDDPSTTESGSGASASETIVIDDLHVTMGLPAVDTFDVEMGIIIVNEQRPAIEWSVWGRLGVGVAPQRPDVIARSVTVPMPEVGSAPMWEAAVAADLTFGLARHGDLRLGVWGEARTSSDPVAGAELVLEGLSPHPYGSRIGGAGSLVLRAGANTRVVTGALGFGYVGSWPRSDPWIRWARHVVGARVVVSVNRAIDEPQDWSATVGLEVEPIGAVHALLELVTGR